MRYLGLAPHLQGGRVPLPSATRQRGSEDGKAADTRTNGTSEVSGYPPPARIAGWAGQLPSSIIETSSAGWSFSRRTSQDLASLAWNPLGAEPSRKKSRRPLSPGPRGPRLLPSYPRCGDAGISRLVPATSYWILGPTPGKQRGTSLISVRLAALHSKDLSLARRAKTKLTYPAFLGLGWRIASGTLHPTTVRMYLGGNAATLAPQFLVLCSEALLALGLPPFLIPHQNCNASAR